MSTVEFVGLKHFAFVRFDSNLFEAFVWDKYHIYFSFCAILAESFRLNIPIYCNPSVDLN